MRQNNTRIPYAKRLGGAGALLAAVFALPLISPTGVPEAAAMVTMSDDAELLDEIVFRSGRILRGRIVDETNDRITFEGELNGIPLNTTYEKSTIAEIRRGVAPAPEKAEPARSERQHPSVSPRSGGRESNARDDGRTSVYLIELSGRFRSDVHEAPLRDALEDARDQQPDYLIVKIDTDWVELQFDEGNEVEIPTNPDELFYAEQIEPLFTEEIRDTWPKQPELVFWVKNAMGGSAFMPFFSETMFFHPEGRIGGLGYVDELFEGDEMFNAKQISLRMGHAQGLLIARGYEPRLADALMREHTVLSYSIDGGEPVYHERMPESESEFLLTDDGDGPNEDTLAQAVRGQLNDTLTLDAETARRLRVSMGTVETLDDLLFELGVNRDYRLIDGKSERIMETWSRRVRRTIQDVPKMWEEYQQIGQGRNATPAQLRGQRIRKLEQIKGALLRMQGAVPGPAVGVPSVAEIDQLIAQIRLQGLGQR
ncbi:MAG: hypothetical protein AAGB51_13355 [Planctomycetota bacterium]